ncbi:MAG: ATP-grasp domain-containing protein [Clostridia bacterium]|nr:ATP-grasp domain-containing protein [Clostridia bacterium]
MLNAVLFPSDYFDEKSVDPDLKKEYDAALECRLYDDIILFSYDDWFHHRKIVLDKSLDTPVTAVYRGWMMSPEAYNDFYNRLKENNICLITSPEEYSAFHIFPDIYEIVKEDTPGIMLFPKGTPIDLNAVKARFSRFMVKDYVKSVKGTDFPRYFDSDITKDEFDRWMEKFYEYRGDLFTGGICIKEFVDLKKYGSHKNEYRVFYMNGEIATVSRNSGQDLYTPQPPTELVAKYMGLHSRFYTVDFAELESGDWIVIEAGDGSVSGLSDFQDYNEFFRKLYYSFI